MYRLWYPLPATTTAFPAMGTIARGDTQRAARRVLLPGTLHGDAPSWRMSTFIAKDKISFSIFFTLIHVGGVCKGVVHAPYLYMYTPRLLASYFYYYPT